MKKFLFILVSLFTFLSLKAADNLETVIIGMWVNDKDDVAYRFASDKTGVKWQPSTGIALMLYPNGTIDDFKWSKMKENCITLEWTGDYAEWIFDEDDLTINIINQNQIEINGVRFNRIQDSASTNDTPESREQEAYQKVYNFFAHPLGLEPSIDSVTKSKFEKFLTQNGIKYTSGYESESESYNITISIDNPLKKISAKLDGIDFVLSFISFYNYQVYISYISPGYPYKGQEENFKENFIEYADKIRHLLKETGFNENTLYSSNGLYLYRKGSLSVHLTINRAKETIELRCFIKYE